MTPDEIKRRVAGIRWYHCIDLGNGIVTPGVNNSPFFEHLHLPPSLKGKTVLDIGAWDGYYSFRCEQLGAAQVLATDQYCWGGDGWGKMDGFLLARKVLRSKVQDENISPEEISADTVGLWDIVLLLGVLYHMKNPVAVLQSAWTTTKEVLIVETHIDETLGNSRPCMIYYPGKELGGDPTNWWGPNRACMISMLETLDPKPSKVEVVYWVSAGQMGRAIVKAWR